MNPNNFNNINNNFGSNIPQMPSDNEPKISRPTEMQKMNDPFFQNNHQNSSIVNDANINKEYNTNYSENSQKNTKNNKIVYKYLAFLLVIAITGVAIYLISTFLK